MSYEVSDIDSHEVGANAFAAFLNSSENDHNRYLDVTVRVGDQKLDNYRRVRGDRITVQTSGTPESRIEDAPAALKSRMWLETGSCSTAPPPNRPDSDPNQSTGESPAGPRSVERLFATQEAWAHSENTFHATLG